MIEVTGNLWNYNATYRVITTNGSGRNHVMYFPQLFLFTFPVKHHWYEAADLKLIERSVREFEWVVRHPSQLETTFVMPRPGCGFGRLTWEEVKPLLVGLPDNVHVITR